MMMLIPKTWKCFTPRINGKLSVQVTCCCLITVSLQNPIRHRLQKPCSKLKIPVCSHDNVFLCCCSDKEVQTQWPSTERSHCHQTRQQQEWLLKCLRFTRAGRAGCQSNCRWWCVSVTSSKALSLFVCLSGDRFHNVYWHAISQVCCAPLWIDEMLLSGNLIKNCHCNTTQLLNNGFSVP